MNFFIRNKKRKSEATAFLELLKQLNSDLQCSFEVDKDNMYIIYSTLKKEQLASVRIPHNASYEWSPTDACYFGHISIFFNSKKYTIYAENCYPDN